MCDTRVKSAHALHKGAGNSLTDEHNIFLCADAALLVSHVLDCVIKQRVVDLYIFQMENFLEKDPKRAGGFFLKIGLLFCFLTPPSNPNKAAYNSATLRW